MQPKISFIGVGNMATAIIRGLIQSGYPANLITGTSRNAEKRTRLEQMHGIQMLAENKQAVQGADIVVLCVKPVQMQDVVEEFKAAASDKQLYISVAAGLAITSIQSWLGENIAIVRSMPNTPAQVGAGMTGLTANSKVTAEQKGWTDNLFNSVGKSVWVDSEEDMHAVTALSGSAPAYFFRFLEAMIKAGQKQGLTAETSRELASYTMLGAARMVTESSEEIATLRQNITSPKGTTEQALLSFESNNIDTIVEQALAACSERSKEMAQLFSKD